MEDNFICVICNIQFSRPNLKIYHYDLTKNIGNEDDVSALMCIKACLKFHEKASYSPNNQEKDIISSVTYIENENILKNYKDYKECLSQRKISCYEEYLFHGTDRVMGWI